MSMQHAEVSTQGRGGHTGGMGMAQKRARNDSKQKENNRNQKKGTYTRRGCGQFVVALFCHGDKQVSPRCSNGLSRILSQTCQFIKDIAHLWVIPFRVTCWPVLMLFNKSSNKSVDRRTNK